MREIKIKVHATDEEIFGHLREYCADWNARNKPKKPEFEVGDKVVLDTGQLGMVCVVDSDGEAVVYFDEDGDLCGPANGYRLTKYVPR